MERELAQIADAYMKDVESVCLHMMQAFGVNDKDALMEYHDIRQTGEFYIDGEVQKYYFHGLGCSYQNSRLHINWEFGTEDTWCGISPSWLLGYIQKNAIEPERSYDVASIEKEFEQAVSCGEWIKRWDLYYKVDGLWCYYGESSKIEQTAERLLGRNLFPTDGIRNGRILSETEQKLHVSLPGALKRLYYFVGRQEIFMSSFQQILSLDTSWCDGNHLFFAKENQEVCLWSVDLTDLQVYQNVEGSRYPEEISLEDFLLLLMYYNFAENGYEYSETKEYSGSVEDMKLDASWEQVVHHNGLVIYERKDSLLWYFYDTDSGKILDDIFVAARTKEALLLMCEEL